ncbi:hypothetical protein [Ancylobacter crimeensis]|nr:hypothetical protein [Ancylobacter crimeensis]
MIDRRRARNFPLGPFDAIRQGHDCPPRKDDGPFDPVRASQPVTLQVPRKVGRRILSVHPVTMEAADWHHLRAMGYGRLHINAHGVASGTGSRSVPRLIACAGHHETVAYRDGDPCNLCRGNLVVITRHLHHRATGHYPACPSDGEMTVHLANGAVRNKPKAMGLTPQDRLRDILSSGTTSAT